MHLPPWIYHLRDKSQLKCLLSTTQEEDPPLQQAKSSMTFAQQMPVGGRMPYAANDQSINVTLLHAARKVGRVETRSLNDGAPQNQKFPTRKPVMTPGHE